MRSAVLRLVVTANSPQLRCLQSIWEERVGRPAAEHRSRSCPDIWRAAARTMSGSPGMLTDFDGRALESNSSQRRNEVSIAVARSWSRRPRDRSRPLMVIYTCHYSPRKRKNQILRITRRVQSPTGYKRSHRVFWDLSYEGCSTISPWVPNDLLLTTVPVNNGRAIHSA